MKMKSFTLLGCLAVLMLSGIVVAQMDATADRMQWFQDAKFGMFIHFGVGNKSEFNPDFDAGEWARVAKAAGMKYVVLTTKHHVGFCLWDSALTDWNVVDQTPYKRDIVKDLAAGCKAEGLEMGCYYSIADYHHPLYEPKYQNRPNRRTGTVPGADINKYIDFMFGQLEELCELYHPCLIWFDGGSGFSNPAYKPLLRRKEMVDMLHSYGTLSNSRLGDDDALKYVDYLSMNDNMTPAINLGVYFESAVTMGRSWHFRANDSLKSPKVLLEQLVNTAGNGGNYLLNVGPDMNGVIPKDMEARLKTMGDWLKKNGEAIYETEAGPYRYEISWGTITQRKDKDSTSLYLNVVDWPKDGKFTLFGVNNPVLNASLLATGEAIKSESKFDVFSGQNIITLEVPKDAPDEYVSVIKLVVSGTVSMDQAFMQLSDGKVLMDTYNANIHDLEYVPNKPTKAIDMKMFTVPDRRPQQPSEYTGPWDYQMYKKPGEGIMPGRGLTVSGFQTKGQALSWDFRVYKPGTYEVVVVCHANRNQTWNMEGRVRASVAGQSVENELIEYKRVAPPTMNSKIVDLHSIIGTVKINSAGAHTLTLEIASNFTGAKPRFRSVMLVPANSLTRGR
ncbi:MAG TPA: alpha-L-fucosidase [Sedimentisphaerales bacterium]|nr:alpha-L-fucosidase [Sedimentisphaerales bacterium]